MLITCKNCIETVLNIYFLFTEPSSHTIKFPYNQAWDVPQVLHYHFNSISKYSNAKFEFPVDKFFEKLSVTSSDNAAGLNRKL